MFIIAYSMNFKKLRLLEVSENICELYTDTVKACIYLVQFKSFKHSDYNRRPRRRPMLHKELLTVITEKNPC